MAFVAPLAGKNKPMQYTAPTSSLFPYLTATTAQTAQNQIVAQRSTQTPERRSELFNTMFSAGQTALDAKATLPKSYEINKTFEAYGGKAFTPEQRTQYQASEQTVKQNEADASAASTELFGPKKTSSLVPALSMLLGPLATVAGPALGIASLTGFLGAGSGTVAGFAPSVAAQMVSGVGGAVSGQLDNMVDPAKVETKARKAAASSATPTQRGLATPSSGGILKDKLGA